MKNLLLLLCSILIGFAPAMGQTYCFTSPQGYGAGATGGGNATPVVVTTQSALQTALTSSGSKVIIVSGTITCSYMSLLVTNKTLLGLPGARLRNVTQTKDGSGILNLKSGSNNVIIRNLIFEGPGAYDADGRDNLCFEGASKVWVDHCEFQDGMDGNFDNKGGTDNITVSWCKFTYLKPPKAGGSGGADDHRFSNLVGSSDSDKPSDGKYSITWQYCWWAQGCRERMTRARNAQLNMVSCLWNSSVTNVALGLGGTTDCYVENSVFACPGDKYRYYNNGTVRLTTAGCSAPPANVGTAPAPTYTRESIAASSVTSALTGTCGAGATLNVTTSGAVSAKSGCGGPPPVNIFPTVSITSPANNASFTAPASITINANAADADGSVTNVQFYNGSTLLGSDASSPYSFSWANVAAGTYTLTARATDNAGAVTTSSSITVVVNAVVNTPPTVNITSPANNASFAAPASITINANAADANGTVSNVQFYNGSTLLGSDASSPYSFNWTNVAAGTYTLTARATDNNGATTTSSAVTVVVNAIVDTPPTVSITSPSNNSTFTAPASITINANATDANGSVSNVQFYNGSTLLGSDASSPYSFNWTNVAAGTYIITARATDNNGATTTSAAITVVVENGVPNNLPPTVNITSPANSASFTAPASLTISANASDSDGTISNVQFYNGGTLIGSASSAPYNFTWNNVGAGSYAITARATDNAGAVAVSSTVNVTVTGISTGTTTIQAETACSVNGIKAETKNAGFNGAAYVNLDNATGTAATWAVNSATAQTVTLSIRFANGGTISRNMSLQVNNVTQVATVNFPITGAWTTWTTVDVQVTLVAGFNMVKLTSLTSEGAPNLDELVFNSSDVSAATGCTPPPPPDCAGVAGGSAKVDNCQVCSGGTTGITPNSTCIQDCNGTWGGSAYKDDCGICVGGTTGKTACVASDAGVIQAETACSVTGIKSETKNAGFNGAGYVNLDNVTGTSAIWGIYSPTAQTVTLAFRYANASANNRRVEFRVNGITQVSSVDFNSTGAWTNWSTVNVTVTFIAGNNQLQLVSLMNEGAANIDEISFTTGKLSAGSCASGARLAAEPSAATVYPNPSTDAFALTATEQVESFVVVNGMGTVVYQGGALEVGESINFGDSLPSGVYTLHVVYSTGRTEQKIIHKYM